MRPKTYEFRGELKTVKDIAAALGVTESVVYNRMHRGISLEGRVGRPPRLYEFRGEQKTAKEIAEQMGKSLCWVYRHTDGLKIIEPDKSAYTDPDTHEHWPTYFHNGIRDTVSGWSRRTGISRSTIANRIREGWPVDLALSVDPAQIGKSGDITFAGRTMTSVEWAKERGLAPHTLRMRLLKGWSVERALTAPLRKQAKWSPRRALTEPAIRGAETGQSQVVLSLPAPAEARS